MDDLLLKVLSRLVTIQETFGSRVFEDAAHRALVATAVAVQIEAERNAGTIDRTTGDQQVIPFPLAKARRNRDRMSLDQGIGDLS